MSKPVPVGARAEVENIVKLEQTLAGIHDSFPPVYSTPRMIQLMEEACYWALKPYEEGDETTVGTHINVSHKAATGVGVKVKAEAVMGPSTAASTPCASAPGTRPTRSAAAP